MGKFAGTELRINRRKFTDMRTKKGRERLEEAGEHLVGALRETLQEPPARTGRTYRHPFGGTYTASAPGEPPQKVTGELQDSLDYSIRSSRYGPILQVGTDSEYGMKLERGTGRVAARPWFRVTLENEREAIEQILERPWT